MLHLLAEHSSLRASNWENTATNTGDHYCRLPHKLLKGVVLLSITITDTLCLLTRWQHFSAKNDDMAAILKVCRHIKNLTPWIDVYILDEDSGQISFWSDLKWRSLGLFWRGRPNKNKMRSNMRSVSDLHNSSTHFFGSRPRGIFNQQWESWHSSVHGPYLQLVVHTLETILTENVCLLQLKKQPIPIFSLRQFPKVR